MSKISCLDIFQHETTFKSFTRRSCLDAINHVQDIRAANPYNFTKEFINDRRTAVLHQNEFYVGIQLAIRLPLLSSEQFSISRKGLSKKRNVDLSLPVITLAFC